MDTSYRCDTCGRDHRLMEICPEKPGFIQLLADWFDGSDNPMALLAFIFACVLPGLICLGVLAALN